MTILLLCTSVYVFFIILDIIPIIKSKQWKVFGIYAVLITTAYVLTVLNELGVKLPSPATPLKQIVTAVVGK